VGLARAQGYGNSFEKYKEWLKLESIVIVQVEHIKAVENLAAIMSIEGVDGFIVGPYDLSGSLGIPGQFDNELMIEAMSKIKTFMRSSSKIPGYHVVEPDVKQLQKREREGYLFLAYSVDFRMLDTCCRSSLTKIKG
jgi:2-keto-3-deoxy-L-rhamnonate aldolase RhmA